MRKTKIPKYLQFDHLLNVSARDFASMEGKEYYNYLYSGERTFHEGEWICFQNVYTENDFEWCRKLIRKVKTVVGQIPMMNIDDCTEMILYSEPFDLYSNDHYRSECFVNEGSAIKFT